MKYKLTVQKMNNRNKNFNRSLYRRFEESLMSLDILYYYTFLLCNVIV